jgi:adenylate cyclase class 2
MDEIELKFLDIDVSLVQKRLSELGALFSGEILYEEWIFKKPEWNEYQGRIRIRSSNERCLLSYKETHQKTGDGNLEIEFSVGDLQQALQFVQKLITLPPVRHQQKKCVKYHLGECEISFDSWPGIPTYIEIEGSTRDLVEKVAVSLGFDIKQANEMDAREIFMKVYGFNVDEVTEFVF